MNPRSSTWGFAVPVACGGRGVAVVSSAGAQQSRAVREPRLRADPGYGVAASVAIGLLAVADIVSTVSDWRTVSTVTRYADSRAGEADLQAADRFSLITSVAYASLTVIAAALFIVWLRRARENAEFFCDGRHQFGRGWTIGGWFLPIASFWIPRRVVLDVAVASDPWTRARGASLNTGRSPEVSGWWAFWILYSVTGWLAGVLTNNALKNTGSAVVTGLRVAAACSTLSSLLGCVAAFLAVRVIKTINGDQQSRPPIPWWAIPVQP